MRTPKALRTIAFFLLSASIGAGSIVMAPLRAQTGTASALPQTVRPTTAGLPNPGIAGAVDPKILALQAQVASLQAQLNALAAAVQVTPAGLVLQGPTVTITGGAVTIKSPGDFYMRVNNIKLEADLNASVRAGAAAYVQASTIVDLRGSSVHLNGGNVPVALAGSGVANGQILSGSSSVFAK